MDLEALKALKESGKGNTPLIVGTLIELAESQATMRQEMPTSGASSEELAKLGLHPGLCDNDACVPCHNAKRAFGSALLPPLTAQVEKDLMLRFNTAAKWAGVEQEADVVGLALEKWEAAGSPEVPNEDDDDPDKGDDPPNGEAVAALNIGGLKITP